MRRRPLFVSAALIVLAAGAPAARATDWLQFGYDTVHSGFNRAETGYSTATGNTILYHYALPSIAGSNNPGTVDGAPIYVSNVATASGTKNVLFGLTNNGTFYALDADSKTLSVLWSHRPVGTPPALTGSNTKGFGSGAVDPDLQHVYAYAFDGKIHKYQIADGTDVMAGGWPQVSTLKPDVEKGAGGLSVAAAKSGATYLYSVTDGYIGDGGDYQGHLTAINLASGAQTVFNSLCSDLAFHLVENGVTTGSSRTDCASVQNGIWGRPGTVYDDVTDRLFIVTGNGPYNASSGGLNWGDSVLALNPDGTGSGNGMPVDSYTPASFQGLQNTDADLGAASIAILKSGAIGLIAAKDGCVRLFRLDNMSNHVPTAQPGHTGGELLAFKFFNIKTDNCATGDDANRNGGSSADEIRAQPAVWVNPADQTTWVYVTNSNGMAAYQLDVPDVGNPTLTQQWTAAGGTSPVIANGALYYMSGGHLVALDTVTGATLLSASSSWPTTSFSGPHWQSPVIANGRLYLFDNANPSNLWVYQLDGVFKNGFN